MASQLIEIHRANAEIYHGEAICRQKAIELLESYSLPKGLLPITMVELGHNKDMGFIWVRQNKRKEHRFKLINKVISYEPELTMFAEKGRLRNVKGVKCKELLIWITVSDIFIEDASSGKIAFSVPGGITSSFPVSAFDLEEVKDDNMQKNMKNS